MNLIPKPRVMEEREGIFRLTPETCIVMDDEGCRPDALDTAVGLQKEIEKVAGMRLAITRAKAEVSVKFARAVCLHRLTREDEGYELEITPDRIRLFGGNTGLFYACGTLTQILIARGAALPCVYIMDWPAFRARGFFHDVTRGRVPTLETLKDIADRAAFYKLNQLQLYFEHTFAFANQSEVWTGKDPLTPEEILLFDAYCVKRHIELVPALATFGHLYHVLASESFRRLSELNGDPRPFTWRKRMLHHTLAASDPESLKLVKDMLDEMIPLFSSGRFNICCDETFDLGRGRSKELTEEKGIGRVYVDFVNEIVAHVKRHGKQAMMWGDMLLKYPECLADIPDDVIILNWNYDYESMETAGRGRKEKHDGHVRECFGRVGERGLKQYACPSVWGWNRLACNMDISFLNIKRMVSFGGEYGAEGILNTDWGNYGAINFFSASVPGMAYGGALAWNDAGYGDFDEQFSILEYGDGTGKLVGLLRGLARCQLFNWKEAVDWAQLGIPDEEPGVSEAPEDPGGYFWNAVRALPPEMLVSSVEQCGGIIDRLGELAGSVYPHRRRDIEDFLTGAEGIGLLQRLCLAIKKYVLGDRIPGAAGDPDALAQEFERWFYRYSGRWRLGSKESELCRIREAVEAICLKLRRIKSCRPFDDAERKEPLCES